MLVQNIKLIHLWQGGLCSHNIHIYTYIHIGCGIVDVLQYTVVYAVYMCMWAGVLNLHLPCLLSPPIDNI